MKLLDRSPFRLTSLSVVPPSSLCLLPLAPVPADDMDSTVPGSSGIGGTSWCPSNLNLAASSRCVKVRRDCMRTASSSGSSSSDSCRSEVRLDAVGSGGCGWAGAMSPLGSTVGGSSLIHLTKFSSSAESPRAAPFGLVPFGATGLAGLSGTPAETDALFWEVNCSRSNTMPSSLACTVLIWLSRVSRRLHVSESYGRAVPLGVALHDILIWVKAAFDLEVATPLARWVLLIHACPSAAPL